jgi:hypothetical protein
LPCLLWFGATDKLREQEEEWVCGKTATTTTNAILVTCAEATGEAVEQFGEFQHLHFGSYFTHVKPP